MGFFSWKCKTCGHPALSHGATDVGINDWMTDVVVLSKDGSRNLGSYDGYGRAGCWDYGNSNGEPCLYHRACWEVAGKPEYTSPSKHSNDQGWFFADGDHDLLDPRKEHAPGTLERLSVVRDGYKRGLAFKRADEDADEGTYTALYEALKATARLMTVSERVARYGYDPCGYDQL